MKMECLTANELLADALQKFMALDSELRTDEAADQVFSLCMEALGTAWREGFRTGLMMNPSTADKAQRLNPYTWNKADS